MNTIELEEGENQVRSGTIDPVRRTLWLGTGTSPGRIVQLELGENGEPPRRVGAVELENGETAVVAAACDPGTGMGWFATSGSPGRVVKFDLADSAGLPARLGASEPDPDDGAVRTALFDIDGGYAYLLARTARRFIKVALGQGTASPTRIGALDLDGVAGANAMWGSVMDTSTGYAYLGTDTSPGEVIKVRLGEGNALPTLVASVRMNPFQPRFRSAVISPEERRAIFLTDAYPGRLIKVDLGEGDAPPADIGRLTLGTYEDYLISAFHDAGAGILWAVNFDAPPRIIKVATGQKGFLKGTRVEIPESTMIQNVALYSHSPAGNVHLSLYDDRNPRNLLWQSGQLPNPVEEDFLVVPIADGDPAALALEAGTYWLAWQVDTNIPVPSYTEGGEGAGFAFSMPFGEPPPAISAHETRVTSEVWTQYLTHAPLGGGSVTDGFLLW